MLACFLFLSVLQEQFLYVMSVHINMCIKCFFFFATVTFKGKKNKQLAHTRTENLLTQNKKLLYLLMKIPNYNRYMFTI